MIGNDQIFFVDEIEVFKILGDVCSIENNYGAEWTLTTRFTSIFERLTFLLTKYLEQPAILNGSMLQMLTILCNSLLDLAEKFQRKLESNSTTELDILNNLTNKNSDQYIKNNNEDQNMMNHFHAICMCIQLLCRVRGFKHVLKYFPHEVRHLELCVIMLRLQNSNDFDNWSTRYVLLLWLSILNSIPFSIGSLDSNFLANTKTNVSKDTHVATIALSSTSDNPNGKLRLVDTILNICTAYLSDTGLVREAGAYCIAAMLSRPDIQHVYLADYVLYCQGVTDTWLLIFNTTAASSTTDTADTIDNALVTASTVTAATDTATVTATADTRSAVVSTAVNPTTATFQMIGVLYSLCQIFKKGDRLKLIKIAKDVLNLLLGVPMHVISTQTIIRKLLTKLHGKVALILLPPKEATWSYSRGKRSLNIAVSVANDIQDTEISSPAQPSLPINSNTEQKISDDESVLEIEFVDEIEEIIDVLLTNLRDKDTIVRWSAAKNIGRISMRLPPDYSQDIIDNVLLLFDDIDSDASWHGACLASAELARRNILAPFIVEHKLINIIKVAIKFDILKGHNSIGSNVRDAGCYMCWSLGHSYDPIVMSNYIHELGCHMLITAVFDREVNCRRAASAAFQENVGRQGAHSFPHGLEIMAIADYQSLGNRSQSYLNIAPRIAIFDYGLFQRFQYHLRYVKLIHWDGDVRILSSKSIAKLVAINRSKSLDLLPDMIKDCLAENVHTRHGCLLGCSELIYALYVPPVKPNWLLNSTSCDNESSVSSITSTNNITSNTNSLFPSEEILTNLVAAIPQMQALRMFRGKGAEVLRIASCYLIEKISECFIPLSGKMQVEYLENINENLKQPHKKVQMAAQTALRQFLFVYFNSKQSSIYVTPTEKLQNATVNIYLKGLIEEENVAVTRGYALALGVLPSRFCSLPSGRLEQIIAVMAKAVNAEKLLKSSSADHSSELSSTVSLNEEVTESVSVSSADSVSTEHITTPPAPPTLPPPTAPPPTAAAAEISKPPPKETTSATDLKIEEFKRKYLEKQQQALKNKQQTSATLSAVKKGQVHGSISSSARVPLMVCQQDIETRLNIVNAFAEIMEKLESTTLSTEQSNTSFNNNLITIINILLELANDYTVDNRGDVGSWVRQAALLSLERMFYLSFRRFGMKNLFGSDLSEKTTSLGSFKASCSVFASQQCSHTLNTSFGNAYIVNQKYLNNTTTATTTTITNKNSTLLSLSLSESNKNTSSSSSLVTSISDQLQIFVTEVVYPYMSNGYLEMSRRHTYETSTSTSATEEEEGEESVNDEGTKNSTKNGNTTMNNVINVENEDEGADGGDDSNGSGSANTKAEDNDDLKTMTILSYKVSEGIGSSSHTVISNATTTSSSSSSFMLTESSSQQQQDANLEKLQLQIRPLLAIFIGNILRQLGEKLDVIRSTCGEILSRFLNVCNAFPVDHSTLISLIPLEIIIIQKSLIELLRNNPVAVEWALPEITYPFLVALFKELYTYYFKNPALIDINNSMHESQSKSVVDIAAGHHLINGVKSYGYLQNIMSGLVISIGCINDKISKVSKKCFIELLMFSPHTNQSQLQICHAIHVTRVLTSLVALLQNSAGLDRTVIPLIKTFNVMLHNGVLKTVLDGCHQNSSGSSSTSGYLSDNSHRVINEEIVALLTTLLQSVKSELSSSSDAVKIKLGCDLIEMLTSYSFVRLAAMKSLVFMLGHRIAIVRKYVAEVVYMQALSDNYMTEAPPTCYHHKICNTNKSPCAFVTSVLEYDTLLNVLTTTVWEESVTIGREGRAAVCKLIQIEFEHVNSKVVNNATKVSKTTQFTDESLSYSSLVREAGY